MSTKKTKGKSSAINSRLLTATALFLGLFAYYLFSLGGTIPSYRDSGDLIASAATLGIAHPPGYAAYVVAGKAFLTLMPWGNAAYRLNVFSALASAGAAVLLFFATLRFFGREDSSGAGMMRDVAAALPAIGFALSWATWDLARVAEMYALATLLAALLLFLLFHWPETRPLQLIFVFALGLAVHPTLLVLLPVLVWGLLHESLWSRRTIALGAGCLGAGGSILLFLPLRSSQYPLLDWGHPVQWRNFWRVITRADYGGLKLHPEQSILAWTPESLGSHIFYFAQSFLREWGWAAIFLGLFGIVLAYRTKVWQKGVACLVLSLLLAGPAFFVLANLPLYEKTTAPILQPYLLLCHVLWTPFVGYALWRASQRHLWLGVGASLLLLVTFIHARPSSRRDFVAYDFGRDLLRSLPPRAALYEPDDTTAFTLTALQVLHDRRKDLALLSYFRTRWGYEQIAQRYPELMPGEIDNAQDLLRVFWTYSIKKRPFYAELPQKFGDIPYVSQGLAYRADPDRLAASAPKTLFELYSARGPLHTLDYPDFFTRHVVGFYAAAHANYGLAASQAGDDKLAEFHYRKALVIDPRLGAAWNNWGVLADKQGAWSQAADRFAQAVRWEPRNSGFRQNLEMALKKASN